MSWNLTIFLPACLMKSCPSDRSSWWLDGEMKRRRRSFSPEIDRSFIPFCLTMIHQLQFGHYPTAGIGSLPPAEMLVWNMGRGGVEAFGIFYCIISHYCVSTVQLFCSLRLSWSSGMAAAQPVMC